MQLASEKQKNPFLNAVPLSGLPDGPGIADDPAGYFASLCVTYQ